jgi:RES domain-containing protein
MLPLGDLAAALAGVPAQPFSGVLYRAIFLEALYGFHQTPPHALPRPLYNLAAPARGARFTPRNGMATLYVAEDLETAFAEAHQTSAIVRRRKPGTSLPTRPTVLVSARAQLDTVLDLSVPAVQTALATNRAELVRPWRLAQRRGVVPTQQLGEAVFDSGLFQAIRYPSARLKGHCCFAIFTDRLTQTAFVEVYDPDGNLNERLP